MLSSGASVGTPLWETRAAPCVPETPPAGAHPGVTRVPIHTDARARAHVAKVCPRGSVSGLIIHVSL